MNVLDACTFYDVDLLKLEQELYDQVYYSFGIDPDTTILSMSEEDLYFYDIPEVAIDYDSCNFDEYLLESIMEDLVGKYQHYLVFASGCTWNGNSGYKLCNNIKETVSRKYEISLEFLDKGNRKAEFIESSHDVPTGSKTYIIGLTEQEYEDLLEADFNEVESFVEHID